MCAQIGVLALMAIMAVLLVLRLAKFRCGPLSAAIPGSAGSPERGDANCNDDREGKTEPAAVLVFTAGAVFCGFLHFHWLSGACLQPLA